MSVYERARAGAALALKLQASDGVDAIAGIPAAADWVAAAFTPPSVNVEMVPDESNVGSLDSLPPIVGGATVSIPFRMVLRGSGSIATPPEVARLLQAASLVETLTSASVGAPTAATAGTGSTATLATPFAATAELYRGMPITLSGNPATPVTTMVAGYTAGRVATFTRSFSPVLSTATLAQIPINNRYGLSDDESLWKRLTAYAYYAGQLLVVLDCHVQAPSFEFVPGQPVVFSGTLVGIVGTSWAETALPIGAAAAAAGRQTAPLWMAGESQLGRSLIRASSVRVEIGTALDLPPNAESANGFDSPQIMGRAVRATVTAASNSTASPTRFAAYRAGTDTVWSAMVGVAPGNRFGWVMPAARIVGNVSGERNGLATDTLTLQPSQPGAGFFFNAF